MASQHQGMPGEVTGGHGTLRGRGGGAWTPTGVWEGARQIRCFGTDDDCFAHIPSTGSRHRQCQSPALPRCPEHWAGLVEGGEGPLVMGTWPAWPGDSLRACTGVVLASLKAGLDVPWEAALAWHM